MLKSANILQKVSLQNRSRNVDITTEDTVNSKTVAVSTTQKIFARTLSKTEYAEPSNAIIDILDLETADTGQINKRAVIDKKNASICISRVKDLRHTKLIISSLKWLSQFSANPLIGQRRNPVTTAIFVVRLRKSWSVTKDQLIISHMLTKPCLPVTNATTHLLERKH